MLPYQLPYEEAQLGYSALLGILQRLLDTCVSIVITGLQLSGTLRLQQGRFQSSSSDAFDRSDHLNLDLPECLHAATYVGASLPACASTACVNFDIALLLPGTLVPFGISISYACTPN